MAAKIKFLQLCEDARFKIDLTEEDIENIWVGIQNDYHILLKKA